MANPAANVADKCNLSAGHIVIQFKILVVLWREKGRVDTG